MMVEVYDDWKSCVHTALGFVACLNPIWFAAITSLYFAYELLTSKRLTEFVGDILEFTSGAFIWYVAFHLWLLLAHTLFN